MLRQRLAHVCCRRWLLLPPRDTLAGRFALDSAASSIQTVLNNANKLLQDSTPITINGWIDSKPKRIGTQLVFSHLRDPRGGRIQIVDKRPHSSLKQYNVETCIQLSGTLCRKISRKDGNDDGPEYEICVEQLRVLNQSNVVPSQLQEMKQQQQTYPAKYRYLQIRLKEQQLLLRKRFQINTFMRQWLNKHDFVEIETPILFKPTPEGAREFLVPTRNVNASSSSTQFYSLTQSPQQYKQLLMASGIPRYYQFAKCFRDEDLRSDRQPEFTQLDVEMSFANGNQIMDLVQSIIIDTWQHLKGPQSPLLTLNANNDTLQACSENTINTRSYRYVMANYGIDKPNLIAPSFKMINLTKTFNVTATADPRFPEFDLLILRNSTSSINDYQEKFANPFLKKEYYKYRTPLGVPIIDKDSLQNWHKTFEPIADFSKTDINILNQSLDIKIGDIVFACDREPDAMIFENPTPLGKLRQLLINDPIQSQSLRETPAGEDNVAIWVTDFPLFSPVEHAEEEAYANTKTKPQQLYPKYIKDQYVSTHHPFTMINLDTYDKLATDPLQCIGQHYDLVVDGCELGGGSTRIHDSILQNYIFENILKIDNTEELFGHLLHAFEMGTPPHAGFAVGFDRMCSILLGRISIRDVIAFPKSITGSDLVVGSPSTVDDSMLKPYHISNNCK